MKPKIAIITAVYNAANHLPVLLESIRKQNCRNFEFIIIDGGSTDGTIDIIEASQDVVTFYLTEKDRGIYDAWNKGIKNSTADWIMFLGADDILLPDAICSYITYIQDYSNQEIDYISSRMQMIDNNGTPFRTKGWIWEWPLFLRNMSIAHPGSLHSRGLFEKFGLFDISYKIAGDYEFLLRPLGNLKAKFVDKVTVHMSEGGTSDNLKALKERRKAHLTTGRISVWKANFFYYEICFKVIVSKFFKKHGIKIYLRK